MFRYLTLFSFYDAKVNIPLVVCFWGVRDPDPNDRYTVPEKLLPTITILLIQIILKISWNKIQFHIWVHDVVASGGPI